MDLNSYDFKKKLNHENNIKSIQWDYKAMRKVAIESLKKLNLTVAESLTIAVRLSVDSPNLDRFTPIPRADGSYITNETIKPIFVRGSAAKANMLTINRFCAVLSPEIRKYLKQHPKECWNQTELENIDPELCFPHCYYIPKLSSKEREQCISFLLYMDETMSAAIASWRSISLKAALYFRKVYKDTVTVTGQSFQIEYS